MLFSFKKFSNSKGRRGGEGEKKRKKAEGRGKGKGNMNGERKWEGCRPKTKKMGKLDRQVQKKNRVKKKKTLHFPYQIKVVIQKCNFKEQKCKIFDN